MRTLRRLVYLEVIQAVAFVSLGFLALFFFFDFVDELPNLGKGVQPYRLTQALVVVALLVLAVAITASTMIGSHHGSPSGATSVNEASAASIASTE